MPYRVRFTTPDDVPQCTALSRDAMLLSDKQNGHRVETWQRWLREGNANSAVVVDEAGNVVAFGLTVYVRDSAVRNIREGPHSVGNYIHHFEKTCVCPLHEAIKAHRGEGVNLLGFYGWRTDLPPEDAKQVDWLLLQSFLHLHRGLHLKSFTKEVYGEEELRGYVDMGCKVFKKPERFPHNARSYQPYIVGADRQEMVQTRRIHTHLFGLFRHGAPALKLERDRLELVQMAYLLGLSDEEMSEVLGRQKELLRQRWCRLYDKLDQAGIAWHHFGRNNQRHDLLQFVERHREVAFPVLIGKHFYCHPDLARRFPIPVGE